MATIKFFIQSESLTAGIYVRLKDGRRIDAKAKTNFSIKGKDWNHAKGQPANLRDATNKALWGDLVMFQAKLLRHYNDTHNKAEVNTPWLKAFVNPPAKKASTIPLTLVRYFDYYGEVRMNELRKSSVKKLIVIKHLLQRFETSIKAHFLVQDVNEDFKNKFVTYSLKEGYAPNTTARNWKFIKTVCYHADENGIAVSPRLKKIVLKTATVEKIFLNLTELDLIEKVEISQDHLNDARDWLLISCETGQRVSDFLRFKEDMIRYEAGKPLIEFTQLKTGKIMTVPLSKKVISLLHKRKGKFPSLMADSRYNKYIKIVCELAGLTYKVKGSIVNPATLRKESGIYPKWQLVTSHIGRRSFATNNYGRIPTSLLIGATGHSTEKMFLEYIGKTDTQKAMQLAEYF